MPKNFLATERAEALKLSIVSHVKWVNSTCHRKYKSNLQSLLATITTLNSCITVGYNNLFEPALIAHNEFNVGHVMAISDATDHAGVDSPYNM